MDTELIQKHLISRPHNLEWVNAYIEFLSKAKHPLRNTDRHHILPKSVFPQFEKFSQHKWNITRLSYADHLIAHYFLRRAIPCSQTATAFRFMVGLRHAELAEGGYDPDLLSEIAADYELARLEVEHYNLGRVRMFRDDECAYVLTEEVEGYQQEGWTTEYPPQQWIFRADEETRVLQSELPQYLLDGWELGRTIKHSDASRVKMAEAHKKRHALLANQHDAYSYMPRGDSHHTRMYGISEATRAKISATLTGLKQSPETIEKRRQSLIGVRRYWSPEARLRKSLSMQGELHPNWGKTSGMKGKHHSEETTAKMSAAHKQRYLNNPEVFSINKPRGEAHFTYGKPRPESTRSKISASLKGQKQSEATKLLRARKLALSKFPDFPESEHIKLRQLLIAPPENIQAIYRSIKARPAKVIAKGLRHLLTDTWRDVPEREWRGARVWLFCKSGLQPYLIQNLFPELTQLESSQYPHSIPA